MLFRLGDLFMAGALAHGRPLGGDGCTGGEDGGDAPEMS